jgi:thiamine biosynthesis lipoprotein
MSSPLERMRPGEVGERVSFAERARSRCRNLSEIPGWVALAALLSFAASCGTKAIEPPRPAEPLAPTSANGRSLEPSLDRFEYVRMAMGGAARIVLFAPDESSARVAAIAAFDEIESIEQALSDWRDASEVRRVEQRLREQPGEPVGISETLATCLVRSLEVSKASDGAFDVTIAPVVEQWRTAGRAGGLPPEAAQRAALALVGWDRVRLVGGSNLALTAPPGTRFDFGGIGKGFGADRALAVLRSQGFDRAMVELGGDFAIGSPPPGEAGWRIAIATGLGDERIVLTLARCGVATSGDLERFVEVDGVRYSHLVDPRTGVGLTTSIAVTVIAPDATLADALASATSVLGDEHAEPVLSEFKALARIVRAAPGDRSSSPPRVVTIGDWPG